MRFKNPVSFSKDECFYGKTIVLYPNEKQKEYIDKCIDLHRFVYNWTIAQKEEHYQLYKENKVDSPILHDGEITKRFSKLRNETDWLKCVPLHTLRNAIYDAIDSFEKFFNKRSNHPVYKTKKKSKKMFKPRTEDFSLYFIDNKVHIEGFKKNDLILTKYKSGYKTKTDNCKIYNAVITRNSLGQYILSYTYIGNKIDTSLDYKYDRAIGIDLNVKNLIVTSYEDGEIYKTPNVDKYLKSIKRIQRKISKCNKSKAEKTNPLNEEDIGSNAKKRQEKLAKKYKKITDIMDTYIRTVSKKIVSRKPRAIVMETLNVTSMKKKRHVSKSLGFHIGFYKIRRVFEHNCEKFSVPLIFADPNYPSTQLCSVCGSRYKVGISRIYNCPVCGNCMDRDINAAFNLENYAYLN